MLLAVDANLLLGLAALGASLCGVLLTIASVRRARNDAAEGCQSKLRVVQREAEQLSNELHGYRMRESGGYGMKEPHA